MNEWSKELDSYFNHCTDEWDRSKALKAPVDEIDAIDTDIGRKQGFKRVAVHHVIVPPNRRCGFPHAESHEEEFIFVLKGKPHLWLNGYIHDMKEGSAVGFPAGTGTAHSVINNSEEDVHLIVAGETSKDDNLCYFPINPELKKTCGIWWSKPPEHDLGPHNGLPGAIEIAERASCVDEALVHCPDIKEFNEFSYPGDNETFGHGFRVTDHIGLKALGIWYERLAPGKRSAYPHAHTHEEEFVCVLKGNPTVWMDGFTKQLSPGNCACFPSNTGISHVLINDSREDVIYLCIGETAEFADEKIIYPLNAARNEQGRKKGWLWDPPPVRKTGPHNGLPK